MSSRVQSINGNISNVLKNEQNYNSLKPKLGNKTIKEDDSIENIKKLAHISSYNESEIINSTNTLKCDDENDEGKVNYKENNLYENYTNADEIDGQLGSLSRLNNNSCYRSFSEDDLNHSELLKKNFEDLTHFESAISLIEDTSQHEEEITITKCPSCPEKIFKKTDDMTIFENNNEEIDFYTNEKIVSNNCWSKVSKLRRYASNLELYSSFNKKSKLSYNFLEEFTLGEGINYLSDFEIHDSNLHLGNDEGFFSLHHSNGFINELEESDSDSDSANIKNYLNQKRMMLEKIKRESNLSNSSSLDQYYSVAADLNCIDDSKNTLISSFNSLQIDQRYNSDEEENKILEVFDFIKEYRTLVNSIDIQYNSNNNKIYINGKPLENRDRYSLDEYQEIKTVGNGAYGKLVECIHLPTNRKVILKRIPVNNINHWYIKDVMTMEEYSLRKNIHPRIITLHDAFFYHPNSPIEKDNNEKDKTTTKSQTFATNIKNKFKNLNKVLRGGKKKREKEKDKDSEEEKEKEKEKEKEEIVEEEIVEEEEGGGGEKEGEKEKEEENEKKDQKEDEFVLVTEYLCEKSMDLYDYIESVGPIPENNVKYIFAQIIEAIYFMSKNNFSHGDIKDENVLIDPSTFKIKLIDFGSATTDIGKSEIPYSKFRGTRKYQAPNLYNKDTYDPLAEDIWSLGVMLFVMLFAADPFTSPEEAERIDILEQIYENIQYLNVEKDMSVSDEAVDLILRMLEKDELQRINLEEIIYHPFFRI